MTDQERREAWQAALLAFGLTGLVFLVSSANVCSLMLSRAVARIRELGIRLALGASRWRLIRGLLAEGGLLGAPGAVAGLLFGYGAAELIARSQDLPFDMTPDWRTYLFALAFACVYRIAQRYIKGWIRDSGPCDRNPEC